MQKHELALVETPHVGEGTHIAPFAHVLPGAVIGRNCTLGTHAYIPSNVILEDSVSIAPNAVFAPGDAPTRVRAGASVGPNSTVMAGIAIGERAVIAPGAVVAHNVPPNAIVSGNPAAITGYVDAVLQAPLQPVAARVGTVSTSVRAVTLHRLPRVEDLRGPLSFAESGREIPFEVKRYFVVFGVASKHVRGEHAHKTLHQFLVCVNGSCSVIADDGRNRQEFLLDSPDIGLHLPPMTWGIQHNYSRDGVLLVLASDYYDPSDYIRDYNEFCRLVRQPA